MLTKTPPAEFPTKYATEEIRQKEWEAYLYMRKLLSCPEDLDFQAGHDWCAKRLESVDFTKLTF